MSTVDALSENFERRLAAKDAEIAALRDALSAADLQMDYLDGRWPTGTTPAVRALILAALEMSGGVKAQPTTEETKV